MPDEEAKATQEIAKATGKGIDAAREFGGFFSKVFGGGLENLGGTFGDWASVYRYKNILKLRDKVNALHKERGLDAIEPIPFRIALPFIEKVSAEDDEGLQDMWARLLVNANDKNSGVKISKIYVDILASLQPLDAKIVDYLGLAQDKILTEIVDNIEAGKDEIRLSISNLHRLGCLAILTYTTKDVGARIGPVMETTMEENGLYVLAPHSNVVLNELGRTFYIAVSDSKTIS